MEMPDTRYARCGDLQIAYQVLGDGPIDLVYVPGWISHVEMNWDEPYSAHFMRELARFARLITFDKRGTGMSDGVPLDRLPTLEERADDLVAVMDAVGSERAALFGVSEGGNLSAYMAAAHPDRVSALVLFATFAKRIWSEDYPWAPTPEERQATIEYVRDNWADLDDVAIFAPSMIGNADFLAATQRRRRRSASPSAAVALLTMNTEIDIRNILPAIQAPTLLLHRTGDRDSNPAESRYMEERIPNAQMIELEGEDHFPWVGDTATLIAEIERFVTGSVAPTQAPATRVLASLLFTDIVGSTDLARQMGDLRWKETLDAHDQAASDLVAEHGGQLVTHTGDGMLATFAGPGRAISCARALQARCAPLGIQLRAGLHTGECEVRGDNVSGVAVHLAARVQAQASPGEVLVSRTVRDLVAGSGHRFEDRGNFNLKGFDDPWQLFAVI